MILPGNVRSALVSAALAGGAVLFAAGPHAPAAAAEVNVYSSRHYKADQALYDSFTRETGIKVNIIQGNVNALFERLKREGRNSPADVLITVDAGNLGRAEDAGLFRPMTSELAKKVVPASMRQPDGLWVGLTMRARVIMYHKDRVKPSELSTYEALADPKWKGRILVRSSNNIYNQSLVASLIAAHGKDKALEWSKAIVANMARTPKGGDRDQIRAVGAGEGDIAISNTYYFGWLTASEESKDKELVSKIGVFFPNQDGRGTHANVSGAGVVKGAPNRDNAVELLEYLTTEQAQVYFAEGNNEFPVVEGVEVDPILAAWGDIKTDDLNAAKYGENNSEAVKLMDRAGWK
jgi:iron(III) transport system substrate-binding protein